MSRFITKGCRSSFSIVDNKILTCDLQGVIWCFSRLHEHCENCTIGTTFYHTWLRSIKMRWGEYNRIRTGIHDLRKYYYLGKWRHSSCCEDMWCNRTRWLFFSCDDIWCVRACFRRGLRSWQLLEYGNHVFLSIKSWRKVDLTSCPSYVASRQGKLYVPGFLVVTSPNNYLHCRHQRRLRLMSVFDHALPVWHQWQDRRSNHHHHRSPGRSPEEKGVEKNQKTRSPYTNKTLDFSKKKNFYL